jgi:hypothetical protein
MDPILAVRLLIGDVEGSPFYQIFTDEEIQYFLDINGGNIRLAARDAAIAASMQIAGVATRERVGDVEVWRSAEAYLSALKFFITNPVANIPNGLMPWAGGISKTQVCENNNNPDLIKHPLENINTCDSDDICACGCGCLECLS